MARPLPAFPALSFAAVLAFVASVAAVGCSGSVVVDATTDASSEGGDGGCVTAVEGAGCSSGMTACMPPGDPCCIGYVWSCDSSSGSWKKLGLGCACLPPGGSFDCGGATCTGGQLCASRSGGVDSGGPSGYHACEALPPACATTPTCECVRAHLSPSWCMMSDCRATPDGHVTISCMGV